MALNHFSGSNTILSSFNNVAPFQNSKISEYPFNDSIRYKVNGQAFFNLIFISNKCCKKMRKDVFMLQIKTS